MKTLVRLLVVAALIIFLLFLFRPDFISNAGNALIKSVGGSAAYGSAQLVPKLQGTGSNLQVSLQGLSSRVHYVVTLEEGRCGGTVLTTIGNVSSDANGGVTSTFSLDSLKAVTQQNLYINVHEGNDASGPSVACGQVLTNNAVATQYTTTSSTSTTSTSGSQSIFSGFNSGVGGFPQTGVAPAKKNSYDNYKYPRKY